MANGISLTVDLSGIVTQIREIIKEELQNIQNPVAKYDDYEELSAKEVAMLIKASRQTVYNYVKKGYIKQHLRSDRGFYIKSEVIEARKYLEDKPVRKTKKK